MNKKAFGHGGKRLPALLLLSLLLSVLCCAASAETAEAGMTKVELPRQGVTLFVPSGYAVITRDMTELDPVLTAQGATPEDAQALLDFGNYLMLGIDREAMAEGIWITVSATLKPTDALDLDEYNDAELEQFANQLNQTLNAAGYIPRNHNVLQTDSLTWFRSWADVSSDDTRSLYCVTVRNGWQLGLEILYPAGDTREDRESSFLEAVALTEFTGEPSEVPAEAPAEEPAAAEPAAEPAAEEAPDVSGLWHLNLLNIYNQVINPADLGDSGFVRLNADQSCLIALPGTEEIAGAWTQEGDQILLRLDGETQTLLILGDVLQLRLNQGDNEAVFLFTRRPAEKTPEMKVHAAADVSDFAGRWVITWMLENGIMCPWQAINPFSEHPLFLDLSIDGDRASVLALSFSSMQYYMLSDGSVSLGADDITGLEDGVLTVPMNERFLLETKLYLMDNGTDLAAILTFITPENEVEFTKQVVLSHPD